MADIFTGSAILGWFVIIISIAAIVAYIYTLVKQAKEAKWVWFVLTLLFPVTMIVYWIVEWVS